MGPPSETATPGCPLAVEVFTWNDGETRSCSGSRDGASDDEGHDVAGEHIRCCRLGTGCQLEPGSGRWALRLELFSAREK